MRSPATPILLAAAICAALFDSVTVASAAIALAFLTEFVATPRP